MQVKDYLQALSDEGKIRVEKIGTGNWYWSFLTEEKRNREKTLTTVKAEKEKITTAVKEFRIKTEEAKTSRDDESEGEDGHDRESLTKSQLALQVEVEALKVEFGLYKDNDPMEMVWRREQTMALRASAERWTENIHCLERYYLELGGESQALEQVRQMLYGPDYRAGEGLAEL